MLISAEITYKTPPAYKFQFFNSIEIFTEEEAFFKKSDATDPRKVMTNIKK